MLKGFAKAMTVSGRRIPGPTARGSDAAVAIDRWLLLKGRWWRGYGFGVAVETAQGRLEGLRIVTNFPEFHYHTKTCLPRVISFCT